MKNEGHGQREYGLIFRNRLREDRMRALANAEDFIDIVRTLEELGQVLSGRTGIGLRAFEKELLELANGSRLAEASRRAGGAHLTIDRLLHVVREARNDHVHMGAFARKAVSHAIELALIVEDALVSEGQVSDFMVRNPVTAELW